MSQCVIRRERQNLCQQGFGLSKMCPPVFINEGRTETDFDPRPAKQSLDTGWINAQSSLKEIAGCRQVFASWSPVNRGHPLEAQFDCTRINLTFRTLRLGQCQFSPQLIGEPRDDFVLHVEEIGYRLVEPFRPQVVAGLSVD